MKNTILTLLIAVLAISTAITVLPNTEAYANSDPYGIVGEYFFSNGYDIKEDVEIVRENGEYSVVFTSEHKSYSLEISEEDAYFEMENIKYIFIIKNGKMHFDSGSKKSVKNPDDGQPGFSFSFEKR